MSDNAYKVGNKNNQQENQNKVLTYEKINVKSPSSNSQRKDCYGNNIDKEEKKHKIMFSEHMVKVVVVDNFKKFNIVNDKKNCSCKCNIF